jgi:Asp-tRNA(Asn)/Glu-tRNA(Gln) amidotransferase A subunit family amidase
VTVHSTASHMQRSAQLTEQTARFLVGAIRGGELSATVVVVVEACLQQVAECERPVKIWSWVDPDHVLQAAARADARRAAGQPLGLLHGLPVSVKDIIDTFDMPTECGTPIRRDRRPTTDATIVSRLRAAGAIILGKTVTAELAFLLPSGGIAKRFGRVDVNA